MDLSLQAFKEEFKQEKFKPPKVFDLKNGKKVIEGEEFRERHEAVFYSGGCIVRTTKRGVKESRINASQGGRRDGGSAYRVKGELSDRRKDSRGERSNKDYSRRRHESSTDRIRERSSRRSRTRSRSPIKRKSQDYHRGDREHKKREDCGTGRSHREDERRDGRGRQRGDERRSNLKH